MSEREIRRIIRVVCEQLDRQARKAVYPAMIGAGLVMGGCGDDMGKPMVDAGTDGIVLRDYAIYAAPDAIYAAPNPDKGKMLDGIIPRDAAIYSSPDAIYAAPNPDKGKMLDGIIPRDVAIYSSPDAIYAAPNPDKG